MGRARRARAPHFTVYTGIHALFLERLRYRLGHKGSRLALLWHTKGISESLVFTETALGKGIGKASVSTWSQRHSLGLLALYLCLSVPVSLSCTDVTVSARLSSSLSCCGE